MKRYCTALILFILLLNVFSLKSQTVSIVSVNSSPTSICLPNSLVFVHTNVELTGYSNGGILDYKINFGDGTIYTDTAAISAFPGIPGQTSGKIIGHIYKLPGTYTVTVIVNAPGSVKDTFISSIPLIIDVCGNIKGSTYVDSNNDCVFNTGDVLVPRAFVVITDNNTSKEYYTLSDQNGDYELQVPSSTTYSVKLNYPYLNVICPIAGHNSISIPATGVDLGIECGSGFDLFGRASMWPSFTPGRNRILWITPLNASCNKKLGTISAVLSDPRISYTLRSGSTPVVNGDTVTWNFTNLDHTSLTLFNTANVNSLFVLADTLTNIGDTICVEIIVTPFSGDNDVTNNVSTYCFPVSNSFDPNIKTAQPIGIGVDHVIDTGMTIDYTIQFQNTGNDVAYDVFILDTLDENLDVKSIVFNGSSHNMDWELFDNNIIRFNFPNINLPDSNSNEPESHGFASYSIAPKSGIKLGTTINNSAAIYFDYNDPIITNTVSRMIGLPTSIEEFGMNAVSVKLYPNPTKGYLNVDLNNAEQSLLKIYSIVGQEIESKNLKNGNNLLDLTNYKSGMYLFQFFTNGKTEMKRVVVE